MTRIALATCRELPRLPPDDRFLLMELELIEPALYFASVLKRPEM